MGGKGQDQPDKQYTRTPFHSRPRFGMAFSDRLAKITSGWAKYCAILLNLALNPRLFTPSIWSLYGGNAGNPFTTISYSKTHLLS